MDEAAEVRRATPADAAELADLLDAFNREFETPTPGPAVLEPRLRELLAGHVTAALVAGRPALGLALVTTRPNVWYPGPVALLDELYVVPDRRGEGIGSRLVEALLEWAAEAAVSAIEINVDEGDVDAQRFYARHGFTSTEPGSDERALYLWRELHT